MVQNTGTPLTTWEHLWTSIVKESNVNETRLLTTQASYNTLVIIIIHVHVVYLIVLILVFFLQSGEEDSYNQSEATLKTVVKRHNDTLHKTTSLAVLIKV